MLDPPRVFSQSDKVDRFTDLRRGKILFYPLGILRILKTTAGHEEHNEKKKKSQGFRVRYRSLQF